jgi:CRISPR-associated protein Cst2
MSFISAMFLVDAPASALNNSGQGIVGSRTDNTTAVKFIDAKDGDYPYVSAQAFRYWLRSTLENASELGWKSSPIYREEKVAYTDANPLLYWDDDLFGYMRAPSKKKKDKETTSTQDPDLKMQTPLENDKGEVMTVTRAAPLRVSTLVSIAPVILTADFGTMSRHEGDPVPYEHQFYRTTLRGSLSLNLGMVGTFTYKRRTGFQNLDKIRRDLAEREQLTHLAEQFAYQLSLEKRIERVATLLRGLACLEGGAKQSLNYTDVSPVVVIAAVIRGGNNPFAYVFQHKNSIPAFNVEAFQQIYSELREHDLLLSPIVIGWKPGYLPEEQAKLQTLADANVVIMTPRRAYESLAQWLIEHPDLLDA